MEDDMFDIYDDLEEFDYKVKYEEAANEQKELRQQLAAASERISELEGHNKKLQDSMNNLEKSFQSLLETARAEIKRKDAKIAEIRKEKDDMLFRRKGNPRFERPQENVFRKSDSTNANCPIVQEQKQPVSFEKQNSKTHQAFFKGNSSRHADLERGNRIEDNYNSEQQNIAHESNNGKDTRQMTNARNTREDIRTKDNEFQRHKSKDCENRRRDDNEIHSKAQQRNNNKEAREENRRSGSRGKDYNKDDHQRRSPGEKSKNSRTETDTRRRDYRDWREQRRYDYYDRDRDRQYERHGKESRDRNDARTNYARRSPSDRRYDRDHDRDRNDENYSKRSNPNDRNGGRKRGSHDDGGNKEQRTDHRSRRGTELLSQGSMNENDTSRRCRNPKEQTENRREVECQAESKKPTLSGDEQLPRNSKRKMEGDDAESSTKRTKHDDDKNRGSKSCCSKNLENKGKDQLDIDEYSEDHLNKLRKQLEMEISAEENAENSKGLDRKSGSPKKQTVVNIAENDCSDHKEATSNRLPESSNRHSEKVTQKMSTDQNKLNFDLIRENVKPSSTVAPPKEGRQLNKPPAPSEQRKLNKKCETERHMASEPTQCEELQKMNTGEKLFDKTHSPAISNEEEVDKRTNINKEKGVEVDNNVGNYHKPNISSELKNFKKPSKSNQKDIKAIHDEASKGNQGHCQINEEKFVKRNAKSTDNEVYINLSIDGESQNAESFDENNDKSTKFENLKDSGRNTNQDKDLNRCGNGVEQSLDAAKPSMPVVNRSEAPNMPVLDAFHGTYNDKLINKQTNTLKQELTADQNDASASSQPSTALPGDDLSNQTMNESTDKSNSSALLSYETYLANHMTPVPVPPSEDEIAGTPTKPKSTKKPRRVTQKTPFYGLVGHRIEGFERKIPAKKATLDTSRELKNELFREALGQRSSTPIKSLDVSCSSVSDASLNTSATEVKDQKRAGNDNQQMKTDLQKEKKKSCKVNLDLSFDGSRRITTEDVGVVITNNDPRVMSSLSNTNSSNEGTDPSENRIVPTAASNSHQMNKNNDNYDASLSTVNFPDKLEKPTSIENKNNSVSCSSDSVITPPNYPTKKQKIMTQLMKQSSCERLGSNFVTESPNEVNSREKNNTERSLKCSEVEKRCPSPIKSKDSAQQKVSYSKRKNESLEPEDPPSKRTNSVQEKETISQTPDLNLQNLQTNTLEDSKSSTSRSQSSIAESSSYSSCDTAAHSSSTEKSNPSVNSGDISSSLESKESIYGDLSKKKDEPKSSSDLTRDMDARRADIEQLMRDLNWSLSDQQSTDLENEKKSDECMISAAKSQESDSSSTQSSECREKIAARDSRTQQSSKHNKIKILDVQIITKGGALQLPTEKLQNNINNVEVCSNQDISGFSTSSNGSEKNLPKHDKEKLIESNNTNQPNVQISPIRSTRKASRNGMKKKEVESLESKTFGTRHNRVMDETARVCHQSSSRSNSTISTVSSSDSTHIVPTQTINLNGVEDNDPHGNAFSSIQNLECTSVAVKSIPKACDAKNSLNDSKQQPKLSPNSSMNESQYEKRNISMASSDYVIEKVDNNVINVFITRRKVKKKKKN